MLDNGVCRIEVDSHQLRLRRMRSRLVSWERAVGYARHNGVAVSWISIGLTYRPGCDWAPGHIRDFMLCVRDQLRSKLYGYTWVAELQERGALHYHVLLAVRPGAVILMPDAEGGGWPWGFSRVGSRASGVRYLLKYFTKAEQKRDAYPEGARLYAAVLCGTARRSKSAGGGPVWDGLERWAMAFDALPRFVREWLMSRCQNRLPVRLSGGWLMPGNVLLRSPFCFVHS